MARVSIIGAGYSGLSSACFAAKAGHAVTVFEKNNTVGGRSRSFEKDGYVFDMGPSWYWMPDVFEKFFATFGKTPGDFYELKKLDPGFQIFFEDAKVLQVPANLNDLFTVFENIEKGSGEKLKRFLREGERKYLVGMQLAQNPGLSWLEFANYTTLRTAISNHIFISVQSYVRRYFKNPKLIALMEFPVLFLGARPAQIPALYSLMNYAALSMGTWYPQGGMGKIVSAMEEVALKMGVKIYTNCQVNHIEVLSKKVYELQTARGKFFTDAVIASADYHHVESKLMKSDHKNYSEKYWSKKVLAPSCLIYYVGVNKKIKNLIHHNLFFDVDFEKHAAQIFKHQTWPEEPLFYVCCPSKTDHSVAPPGCENLFLLMPVAAGLQDTEDNREFYFGKMIKRMEQICGEDISTHIAFKRSYCLNDFSRDYHAYKGNAYGLANTLRQTAVLKPKIINKKISNLFYTGQLTVPGPGVPPALISGEIAVKQMNNYFNSTNI
jgi:phytoene desaturase